MSRRLGWLGPAIVAVGAAIAAVGVWYAVSARPTPGDVIDTITLDPHRSVVIRAEQGGPRSFVELITDGSMTWQALIPAYAGAANKRGVAWNEFALSIRVIRGDRAEVFALSFRDSTKLGGVILASGRGPIDRTATGPLTLTDHVRSYELVAGTGWHVLVAVDLQSGKRAWDIDIDLGADPVDDAVLEGDTIWVTQSGTRRGWNTRTGQPTITNQL
ncbi:MAG: hypothetical protein AB7P03_28220 [Kofleriaceae bacterium]